MRQSFLQPASRENRSPQKSSVLSGWQLGNSLYLKLMYGSCEKEPKKGREFRGPAKVAGDPKHAV